MRINLKKSVFTEKEVKFIRAKLKLASERGYIIDKPENNPYLLASFKGVEEKGITSKWNIKIYTYNYKKGGHSLLCVDQEILGILVEEDYERLIPPDLELLTIDDAGWGFPLCGVMVGVSDEREVRTAIVPVEYFRDDTKNNFQTKRYLKKYSQLARQLLKEFGASPETHRIEICTGYINQPLRKTLRNLKYDVRVVEVKGLLQDQLEELYREYVIDEVGSDIYYDPKTLKKSEISRKYYQSLEYGRKVCPEKVKTGWKAIS